MNPTLDDAGLLAAWHQYRDADAFRILCERHVGLVQRACRRQRSPDVEEAVQAVFLVLSRRSDAVPGAQLGGWLTITAQRVVKDQHRAAIRRRRHEQEAAVELARQRAEPVEPADPDWQEAAPLLDAALASLSAARREAILRFYLEGKPQATVAAELGCSVDAVKMRVHEGVAGLRRYFSRRGVALGSAVLIGGLMSEASAGEPGMAGACVSAVITPASALPGAVALARGTASSFLSMTTMVWAVGIILACVGVAVVLTTAGTGSPPMPAPPSVPIAALDAPATPAHPVMPAWAVDHGSDRYGDWSDLRVAGITQRFRWIRPGTFIMGSPPTEMTAAAAQRPQTLGWYEDEIRHQVTLTRGFWLADTTCTQALWQAVTATNPASFTDSLENPVEQVSWDDGQRFLANLRQQVPAGAFRLPTEAQWEYACRAGTQTAFSFGATVTTEQVNCNPFGDAAVGAYREKTVAVKSLPPNPWGLYEMHGNVLQWCSDWYGPYPTDAVTDPGGPAAGVARVCRGGNWGQATMGCRSARRAQTNPDHRGSYLGFRIAADAEP